LTWTPPADGPGVTTYVVEVGSSAGAADLAQVATNSPSPRMVAPNARPGAYYVRVRGANAAGVGASSNEVFVVVDGGTHGGDPGPGGGDAVPGAPLNLNATAPGGNLTMRWDAGAGSASSYVIEAGSAPGARDLASFSTNTSATEFHTSGVGAGVYYLRVRAANTVAVSAPSNEVQLTVGGGSGSSPSACSAAPQAPGGLAATVAGQAVTLVWGAAGGQPTSYVLEAGSAPGSTNLVNSDLGGNATSLSATGVGSGRYFVRVRAKNACGTSGPSNEIIVVVP